MCYRMKTRKIITNIQQSEHKVKQKVKLIEIFTV